MTRFSQTVFTAALSLIAAGTASAQDLGRLLHSLPPEIRLRIPTPTVPAPVPSPPAPAEPALPQAQHLPDALYLAPPHYPHGPRLGIQAVSTGSCVEVVSVGFGTPAARLGLEPGDRILRINDHPVRSISELQYVLQDAAAYHHGQITVLVDNVRARRGEWGAQRYVTAHTYLDGFAFYGGPTPSGPTPVPTYAAPASSN